MHRAERKGGVGGGGKLMRADGKGKKGQEKRKERENREKFFSHLPSPPSTSHDPHSKSITFKALEMIFVLFQD